MNLKYVLIGAVLLVGGYFGYMYFGGGGMADAATAPIEVEGLDDPETLIEMARGVEKGDPNAPVTIIEFADYQCPFCAVFFSQEKSQIELAYIETGQARFVFHDFPLMAAHPHAFFAARAARCAEDQGKFWEYHDRLFQRQAEWSAQPSPARLFMDYAGDLGLETGDFKACLNSDRHADVVTANLRLAEALGIPGTPGVMVQARGNPVPTLIENSDFRSIQTAVDAILNPGS